MDQIMGSEMYGFTDPFEPYETFSNLQVYDGNRLEHDQGSRCMPLQKTKKPIGVTKKQARQPRALPSFSDELKATLKWEHSPDYHALVRSQSQQNPISYQQVGTPMQQGRSLDGCCWSQPRNLFADFSLIDNGSWELPQYPASAPAGVKTFGSESVNTLDAATSMPFDRASINAIAHEGMPDFQLPIQGSYSQYPDLDTIAPLPYSQPKLEASSFLNPTYTAPLQQQQQQQQQQQPTPTYSTLPSDIKGSTAMVSNGSMGPNSRAARRSQEQIAQGARRIAPRGAESTALNSKSTDPQGIRQMTTTDGTPKQVVAIAKESASQPRKAKSPRVYCNQCDEAKNGFTGPYELRRHMQRDHAPIKTYWVCVDKSEQKTEFANCRSCRDHKRYGAQYNAIEHLRRNHFSRGKGGRGARGKKTTEQAGSDRGAQLSIDVLRHWVKKHVTTGDEHDDRSNSEAPVEATSNHSPSADSGIAFTSPLHAVENSSPYVQTALLPHSDLQLSQDPDPLLGQDQFFQSLGFNQYSFGTNMYDLSAPYLDSAPPLDQGLMSVS